MRNAEAPHLPSMKRLMAKSSHHLIEVKNRLVPVIHGRIGSQQHKLFVKSDIGRALAALQS